MPITLKYEFVTTSANFGNMFSMASVSLFLPFLPLLPYSPFGALLGFTPLPLSLLALIGGIAVLYVLATELTKRLFYKHVAW